MIKSYFTKNPTKTRELAGRIAREIFKKKTDQALVVGLVGELGAGKTAFVQGFAKGLGVKEKILSPTFIIVRKIKIKKSGNFKYLYHIDCYRLKNQKELLALGFEKIISDQDNLVLIEWADKIKKILPKNTIIINFSVVSKNTRKITIKNKLA